MFRLTRRPTQPRRGVTLVEMLVTVALLVLMMTVIVQIFQAATGAVSAARTYQDLDGSLRQLDTTIRQDLQFATATFTPPLNPEDNLGYFEYIENSFADGQGEDTDDCLRFTVNAPEGQVFTGRLFVPFPAAAPTAAQLNYWTNVTPITIQSQTAEVIYFLRNGNLYRRVLLVVPDRQSTLNQYVVTGNSSFTGLTAGVFGGLNVGWMGLNDISARPNPHPQVNVTNGAPQANILLNSLGDLTNRENRWPSPRFTDDYLTNFPASSNPAYAPDGVADDFNGDSVPDYWPTLNGHIVANSVVGTFIPGMINEPPNPGGLTPSQLRALAFNNPGMLAFPFVYPYAYSHPDPSGLSGYGWIHSTDPGSPFTTVAALANRLNHSPLDVGDSLPPPSASFTPASVAQTWWGFPTWRETMSPNWNDPVVVLAAYGQPNGLGPFSPTVLPTAAAATALNLLPPMTTNPVGSVAGIAGPTKTPPYNVASYRLTNQAYTDGAGSDRFAAYPFPGGASGPYVDSLWKQTWEDDLVMTGVRSFDVKAYDNAYPGYVDLGWGDDLRVYQPFASGTYTPPVSPPYLFGHNNPTVNPSVTTVNPNTFSGLPLMMTWPPGGTNTWRLIGDTLAHEGRIPPLVNDFRLDPQWVNAATEQQVPNRYKLNELNPRLPAYAASNTYPGFNVGDSNASVIRLRRTWDSWSTAYTQAFGTAVNPLTGLPYGLDAGGPPVYPSFPPPYRAPLRGLQIQIRVVDPRNERVKVLTIRQDLSDRLGQANQ